VFSSKKSRFRGLLTDLDNTLYDFAAAQESGCRAAIRVTGAGECHDLMSSLLFSVHGAESHEAISEYLGGIGITDTETLQKAWKAYDETKLASIVPYQGVAGGLVQIRDAGIRICAISNACSCHARARLEKLGLSDIVDHLITPDICGYRKPEPGIFISGMETIGMPVSVLCILGDNLFNDIAPAKALGIFGIHARYGDRLPPEFAGDTRPDAIIDSFDEILSILGI
jgi:FMN phosphatase YigB (HAD superfamily)